MTVEPLLCLFFVVFGSFLAIVLRENSKINETIGFLICGIFLGPTFFGVLNPESSVVLVLSEIGIALFLFDIGLELPVRRLRSMRKQIMNLGGTQIVLTFVPLFLLMERLIGLSWVLALALALAFTFSSTALVARLLNDEEPEQSHAVWRVIFPILLFQDIVAVGVFIMLGLMDGLQHGPTQDIAWTLFKSVGTSIAVVFLLLGMAPALVFRRTWFKNKIGQWPTDVRAWFVMALVLGWTLLTKHLAFSGELGAFAAGVVLADVPMREKLYKPIQGIAILTLSVFFMSVGASIQLGLFQTAPFSLLTLLLGISLFKMAVGFLIARMSATNWKQALDIAVLLASCSEFVFIVLAQHPVVNALGPTWHGLLVTTTALSMIWTALVWNVIKICQRKKGLAKA